MFAKLFESKKFGQILAVNDSTEDGKPVVRITIEPPNYGMCSLGPQFSEGEWEKADAFFEKLDIETAEKFATGMYKTLGIQPQDKG